MMSVAAKASEEQTPVRVVRTKSEVEEEKGEVT